MLVQQGLTPIVSHSEPLSEEVYFFIFFNKVGGREMKRDPPTGVKCLPWESFGSDRVMTYITTENKQKTDFFFPIP